MFDKKSQLKHDLILALLLLGKGVDHTFFNVYHQSLFTRSHFTFIFRYYIYKTMG